VNNFITPVGIITQKNDYQRWQILLSFSIQMAAKVWAILLGQSRKCKCIFKLKWCSNVMYTSILLNTIIYSSDLNVKEPLGFLSHTFRSMPHGKTSHCNSFFIPGHWKSRTRTCELYLHGKMHKILLYCVLLIITDFDFR